MNSTSFFICLWAVSLCTHTQVHTHKCLCLSVCFCLCLCLSLGSYSVTQGTRDALCSQGPETCDDLPASAYWMLGHEQFALLVLLSRASFLISSCKSIPLLWFFSQAVVLYKFSSEKTVPWLVRWTWSSRWDAAMAKCIRLLHFTCSICLHCWDYS